MIQELLHNTNFNSTKVGNQWPQLFSLFLAGDADGAVWNARFNLPVSCTHGVYDNLIVADFGNLKIRTIDISDRSVSTLIPYMPSNPRDLESLNETHFVVITTVEMYLADFSSTELSLTLIARAFFYMVRDING